MTVSGLWLLLAPATPLLLMLVWVLSPLRPRLGVLAPWAALPALLLALWPQEFAAASLPGVQLGTHLALDSIGRSLLLLTAVLWWVGGWYAWRMLGQQLTPGFALLFLLAMAGNFGVLTADDGISFYCWFALMSFAAYGMVLLHPTRQTRLAGRVYIALVLLGEVALLSALMLAAQGAAAMDFASLRAGIAESAHGELAVWLLLLGLGVKVGLPGLHFSLPLIYRAAPAPLAAILAGAMINAGLLGWLRLLPAGQVAMPGVAELVMALGMFAAFYGVVIGLLQRDPRVVLGYSSISQMGLVTMAIGWGLAAPQYWSALVLVVALYAVHHGLAKAALFIGLGLREYGPRAGRWQRTVAIGMLLPALALAGAPLTSGLLAKGLLKAQAETLALPLAQALAWVMPLSTVATTLLLARFFALLRHDQGAAQTRLVRGDLLLWGLLLLVPAFWVGSLSQPSWPSPWHGTAMWSALWPILLGLLFAGWLRHWLARREPAEVPPGDLGIWLYRLCLRVVVRSRGWRLEAWPWRISIGSVAGWHRLQAWLTRYRTEANGWRWAMMLMVLLILLLLWPGLAMWVGGSTAEAISVNLA